MRARGSSKGRFITHYGCPVNIASRRSPLLRTIAAVTSLLLDHNKERPGGSRKEWGATCNLDAISHGVILCYGGLLVKFCLLECAKSEFEAGQSGAFRALSMRNMKERGLLARK